jgi:8-oxo-dGTP pyrophosphatase MutT (NUDIX family)
MTNSRQNLAVELKNLLKDNFSNEDIAIKFTERLEQGSLTKDENPKSHFCVYFAAFDPDAKQFFIGHHKKSGLWLFNGGHIDEGETLGETVNREIGEEWGLDGSNFNVKPPEFLTITEINNPLKQPCNFHFDIWHFISMDKDNFNPVESKLMEEFHEAGWKNTIEARGLITDKNTLAAVEFLEKNYFNPKT